MLFKDKNKNFMNEEFSDREYAMLDFELIEDEIDIDSIEKLGIYEKDEKFYSPIIIDNRIKINELVQAVKQLNKEVKELENKIK